ncbi:MAG: hypothetical protein ACYS1A_19235 [Planctomycetota bacterium]|jgi:hypothetical protein
MRGWRLKLVFLLIVYFAGFATAIYTLAPVPENQAVASGEKGFVHSAFKSDEFAKSFNSGMHKAVDFGKAAALRMSGFIRNKVDEDSDDS